MANASFTRDEIILALDYFCSLEMSRRIDADSKEMRELSELLRRLPIHQNKNRNYDFRSQHGVATQIDRFRRALLNGKNSDNIGRAFFEIYYEYSGKHKELHEIAEAIKRNEPYFEEPFGDASEDDHFPEGVLLGHLHRAIEKREALRLRPLDHCEICCLQPTSSYSTKRSVLQLHLLIPPEQIDGGNKYSEKQFITVCPTCHAVLHMYRPWRERENCGDILL